MCHRNATYKPHYTPPSTLIDLDLYLQVCDELCELSIMKNHSLSLLNINPSSDDICKNKLRLYDQICLLRLEEHVFKDCLGYSCNFVKLTSLRYTKNAQYNEVHNDIQDNISLNHIFHQLTAEQTFQSRIFEP